MCTTSTPTYLVECPLCRFTENREWAEIFAVPESPGRCRACNKEEVTIILRPGDACPVCWDRLEGEINEDGICTACRLRADEL